jgi:pyruvoyl-dependent arginine decarboxylase (PvlArgDC)
MDIKAVITKLQADFNRYLDELVKNDSVDDQVKTQLAKEMFDIYFDRLKKIEKIYATAAESAIHESELADIENLMSNL